MSGLFRVLSVRGKAFSGVRSFSTQVSVLPNQVRVITYPTEDPTATVSISVNGGSASENSRNNGSANFIGQLLLQGNQRSRELQEKLIKSGSRFESSTKREQTLISVRSTPNQVSENVAILAQLVQNPAFDEKEVEEVRAGLLATLKEVRDPRRFVMENLLASAYQESGLGLPTIGSPENLESFTSKHLEAFAKDYYSPQNLSVIGVGAVNHDSLVREVQNSFSNSNQSSSSSPSSKKKTAPTPYIGSMVTVEDDFLPYTKYAIGLKGVGVHHPHYLPLVMLTYAFHPTFNRNVSGGLAVSPRYNRIVSEEKLADLVTPFYSSHSDTGIFGVYFETDPDQPFDAIWELLNNYHRATHNLTSAELARAKALFRSQLVKYDAVSSNITESIARLNLREGQERKSLQDRVREIDSLTLDQAKNIFEEYTNDIEPTISAYGNILHFPDYNFIRSWTSWRRL